MSSTTFSLPRILWLNGRFVPPAEAAISPLDRGFLYGDGIFETMRAEKGSVLYLAEHEERLQRSLSELRIDFPSALNLNQIIDGLLRANDLLDATASVKIVVSRGAVPGLGLPAASNPTVCVIAQAYDPPSLDAYKKGWRVHAFREGFSPPLARHKSLNYLYFLAARQAVRDAGADEAIILDPAGSITETSAGSILARTDGQWWTPASIYQLPGITVRKVSRILMELSSPVERRAANLQAIRLAQTVWILNSLMLIMPVSHIGDHMVSNPAAEEASRLREELIERGRNGSL